MRVNHGLKPPDGPHFPVAPGVVLHAHTFDILYLMITEWRMRNGQSPGNVLKDVDEYVCSKWPNACLTEAGDGPTPEDRKRSMAQRIATWSALMTREMPQGGYALVDDSTAKARATVCKTCPYNRAWKTNCAPCNRTSEALLAQIRRLRSVNSDSAILGCEVCGNDLDTAVFLPDKPLRQPFEVKDRLPPGCWIKPL